jgi:hypothetical protein
MAKLPRSAGCAANLCAEILTDRVAEKLLKPVHGNASFSPSVHGNEGSANPVGIWDIDEDLAARIYA